MSTASHRTILVVCVAIAVGLRVSRLEADDVALAWDPPAFNIDGSTLDNLAGYQLYCGTSSHIYSSTVDVGLVTTTTVTNLPQGQTFFFAVSACNSNGIQSDLSDELSWTSSAAPPVDHFDWGQIASPQTPGVPFAVSIMARDTRNATVAAFLGTVRLDSSVVIAPTNTSAFVNGVWTGQVAVMAGGSNIVITATDGVGHMGTGAPFATAVGLIVRSDYAGATPTAGDHYYSYGSNLSCRVDNSPILNGATQYVCRGWTGTGSVPTGGTGTNSEIFTLTTNSTIVWNWTTNYLFSRIAGTNGSVAGSSNGWYAAGGSATVTATPNVNYQFSGWSGNVQGNTNNATLTLLLDQPLSVSANFSIEGATLTVNSALGGTYPGTIIADYGTTLSQSITNSPTVNGTTQFVCVGAAVAGTAFVPLAPTNVTLTLTNNAILTWNWTTNYYLNLAVTGLGIVDQTSGWYGHGQSMNITATPATNWQFTAWTGETNGCASSGNRIAVSMDQPRSIMAGFEMASGPLNSFTWNMISTPQMAGVPFPVTIQAKDANNSTVTGFVGTVSLSGISAPWSVIIGAGTSAIDYPMHTANDDARTQMICLTNDVGRACTIKALALNVTTVPGQTLKNWTIRMKHTTLGSFTSKSVWESVGWTTVYQSNQTVSAINWVEFVFSSPFSYNGTNNLMVDLSFNNSRHTRSGFCLYTTASTSRRLYCAVNSTYGDPLTWSRTTPRPILAATQPNIRWRCDVPVIVNPTNITGFANGVWTGSLSVSNRATGVSLLADDRGGHMGSANLVDVLDSAAYLAFATSPAVLPPTAKSMLLANGTPTTVAAAKPANLTQIPSRGIPPSVSLTNGEAGLMMGIRGTVGADMVVQTSSNLASPFAWKPVNDLLLTNTAFSTDGAPAAAPRDTLEVAFVPALEWFTPSVATSAASQFFRVVMPYDYAVLADKVLRNKGYQTKLIVTRLPGETQHDVCYVGADAAYIDCSEGSYILALNHSGATMREIADDYGARGNMNWTSVSEFVFTNGVRQLVATVVKTDSPSSDPPVASPLASSITVDF